MSIRSVAAVAFALIAAHPAHAELSLSREQSKLLSPFKQVVAKANESTVRVRCDDKDVALGTVVTAKGLILTKASELRGKVTCRLTDGTEYDATILSVHKKTDLALLKIDADGLRAVEFIDSKKVPVGHWLAAAGPHSDPLSVGIVSVATRTMGGREGTVSLNANRGFLGVMIQDDAETKLGAKITELVESGAASKAGMKKGDLICGVGGRTVSGHQALRELLDEYRPDDVVTLKVKRGAENLSLKVKLARDSSDLTRDDVQNKMGSELSGRRTGFPSVLQTDMVIAPKDCGGPIVDLDGKVLGVSIARAGRVETWILPGETIRPLLVEMRAGKHPPISLSK